MYDYLNNAWERSCKWWVLIVFLGVTPPEIPTENPPNKLCWSKKPSVEIFGSEDRMVCLHLSTNRRWSPLISWRLHPYWCFIGPLSGRGTNNIQGLIIMSLGWLGNHTIDSNHICLLLQVDFQPMLVIGSLQDLRPKLAVKLAPKRDIKSCCDGIP